MRNIKFKGKSLDDFKWVIGYGVVINQAEDIANVFNHTGNNLMHATAVEPKTVCQYIGKSTNNAEVWEDGIYKNIHGDLVRVWINEDWQVLIGDVNKLSDSYYTPQYLEPVGNVFDNPELLKA